MLTIGRVSEVWGAASVGSPAVKYQGASAPDTKAGVKQMVKRSWFNHEFVRVVCARLFSTGFRSVPPGLAQLLKETFGGIGQTKVVEDGNKVISLAAEVGNKKLTSREKWHALLRSNVLQGLHRFEPLDKDTAPPPPELGPVGVKPLPRSLHTTKNSDASDPRLLQYSGTGDPKWPTSTGTSVVKLFWVISCCF